MILGHSDLQLISGQKSCHKHKQLCGFREEEIYVFPIVSLWELSVAMETRVLIRPDPKPNTPFPLLNDALDKI